MASGNITLTVQKDSNAWEALQEELTQLFKHLAQKTKNILPFPVKGQWHVDVLLSDSEIVCALNHQYRGKNKPTNVLSFPQTAGIETLTNSSQTCLLGDIVLCWGVINAEALEQKKTIIHHVAHLFVHGLLHLLGFDHEGEKDAESPARDALEELIEEDEASIDPEERLLLGNILDLRDQNASDVIIPRGDLKAISMEATFEEIASVVSASPFTRILVYKGTLDTIVGFVHIKEILKFASDFSRFDLKSILQRILFVSPSMPLLDLLLQMRMTKIPLAVVVDEYGATDGLVAAWDIIREILGDIGDIHDMESAPQMTRISDSSVLVDGRLDLEDLEDALGPFRTEEDRNEDVETVGGFFYI
ncbi:uncharacterized protein LOC111319988 [Stylophora pistillata]|uniref:uncharacterized protein LOC111319988 n=1 Tax=Stylophora pistillata TaxID=50429 RepID=UPI000C040D9C|nr:uncharacterized protein LOC111319988 [Stylophora pistillata]